MPRERENFIPCEDGISLLKSRRKALRRMQKMQADIRRRRIAGLPRYYPKAGYYHWRTECDPVTGGKRIVQDTRYLCYPKSSIHYLKNLSARRVRRLPVTDKDGIRGKGNCYRKFYDYQWAID